MQLKGIEFPRCLSPEEEVFGKSSLIIFSGSVSAFGSVAYIHFKLQDSTNGT